MKRLAPNELVYNDFKEIGESVNQIIINYLSKNYFNQQQLIDFENFVIQFIEVFKNSDLLKVMKYVKFNSDINKAQKTVKKKEPTEAIAPNHRIKMKNEVPCFHYINLTNDLTLYLDKTGGLEPEKKIIEIVLALDDC
uniref:DNA-directed DNA polymerase n=1 Tax=Strongyloides venezuelensis TaxID=75913 RepID=A0A0K0FZE6_STRVS